jgi:hypothetical protein
MIDHEDTDDPVLFRKLETELLLEGFGEGGPWIVVWSTADTIAIEWSARSFVPMEELV